MLAIIQSKIFFLPVLYKKKKKLKIKMNKTVILPLLLHGCETWFLILREEHRLRVSENKMLRKIFGPKREEDGSWKTLHSDELHGLCCSSNTVTVIKSRRMRWAGHVTHMGEGRRGAFIGF
jgi:hypothetical protein